MNRATSGVVNFPVVNNNSIITTDSANNASNHAKPHSTHPQHSIITYYIVNNIVNELVVSVVGVSGVLFEKRGSCRVVGGRP